MTNNIEAKSLEEKLKNIKDIQTDTFILNTQIFTEIKWNSVAKDENDLKQRKEFERQIQFIANNMNQELPNIIVMSIQQAIQSMMNNKDKIKN